jgi:hypothetical protein
MHTCRFFPFLLATSLMFLLGAGLAASPPPKLHLVTFPNPGPDVLADLAGQGWDIWEVTPTQVTARLTPGQVAALHARGVETTLLHEATQIIPSFPQCYRTYETGVTQLQNWANTHPDLTELIDAGPSWETAQGKATRRLWVMRLTNEKNAAPKPKFLLVALHHAREIITPEVALNLTELLLTGYETNADITWLVDNREIWIMPFANPDGHLLAEKSADWRKNTNNSQSSCPGSSPPNSFGVDLNRNYDYKWGTVGASSDPCNLTYRGMAGFSEPETRAIRDLVQAKQFDLVISLHSYSDLILYPWGYTYSLAPDATGLSDIASVLASFNGYIPQQSSDLYPTSGDTCDWAYGTEDIPCLTFEIGGFADGYFWPSCETAAEQWLENRDTLLHAIKLAGSPYQLAQAPVIRTIQLRHMGRHLNVGAALDREATSSAPPAGGEVFIDQIGGPGTGIALQPDDGLLNTALETMTATVDLLGLEGRHTLYVVGATDDGQHGPPSAVYFQPCFDTTGDGTIDVRDVAQIATLWRTPAGDPQFNAALDLNDDHQIDIRDITQIAAQWNKTCGDLPSNLSTF